MARILVADDDAHIRDVVEFALARADHEVALAADGPAALEAVGGAPPDLVVLDVGMPGLDGLEVCRRIRRMDGPVRDVPILFLSARDEEIDRVLGLEIGGDDYVTKPFSPRELTARIASILRRAPAKMEADATTHGVVAIDPERRRCSVAGGQVDLTEREFDILALLIARPGVVRTRDDILEHAYRDARGGALHVSDRTIDSHVRNLRAKLAGAGCPDAVRTVRGVGFALDACRGRAG